MREEGIGVLLRTVLQTVGYAVGMDLEPLPNVAGQAREKMPDIGALLEERALGERTVDDEVPLGLRPIQDEPGQSGRGYWPRAALCCPRATTGCATRYGLSL